MHCHNKYRKPNRGMRHELAGSEARKLTVICGLALIVGLLSWGRAAQPAPATGSSSATGEFHFAKSAFVNAAGVGKDPFFPKSTRRGVPTTTTPEVETGANFGGLSLKGISGSKTHRLAIINNRTFDIGEEGELRVNGRVVRVRCVEIRDDGVTVSINGQSQNLFLGPKL
jgi:hypothetical protein